MAEAKRQASLVKLSDTDLVLADPADDIRGLGVVDESGEEIGEVDDLILDTEEKKIRFLQVAAGGFLGLGETKFMIPVDAITNIDDDYVYVNQSRERIVNAPKYDPDVADQKYWEDVYDYYGTPPYWGAGYMYPGMPFVR